MQLFLFFWYPTLKTVKEIWNTILLLNFAIVSFYYHMVMLILKGAFPWIRMFLQSMAYQWKKKQWKLSEWLKISLLEIMEWWWILRSAKIWLSIVKSLTLDTNATWMNKERSTRKKSPERNFVRKKSQKWVDSWKDCLD